VIFIKKTTDSLISDIARKINHLHDVADKHDVDADVHDTKIMYHTLSKEDSVNASARARRIATRFSALIDGE
jgi:hypothetical protein